MKILQVAIQKIYSINVKDDFNFTDEGEIARVVEKDLADNNTMANNEFYENLKVVCSSCGILLNSDEEKEDGQCSQCSNS